MTTADMSPTGPVVDWPVAAQIAGRLSRPGPQAERAELTELVEGLRAAAAAAVPHVLAVTRMTPAPAPTGPGAALGSGGVAGALRAGAPATADRLGSVHVVDRPRWAKANTEVMATFTDGLAEVVSEKAIPPGAAIAGAAEVGAVLAALSSRVLGQFDPYSTPADQPGAGRLLLVAPNVLQAERTMEVDPADFRLWVCLHEQTHALQFAAAPWLADHLRQRTRGLLVDTATSTRELAAAKFREKLAVVGRALLAALRGDGASLAEGFLSAEQRETLAEVTAVMALLEGHADVAMDAVGAGVVPTVGVIRSKFERRRDGAGRFDVVLRRLLGMDAKIAQYRDGAAFVRAVEAKVGRDGLNAVWAEPGNLPTAREIADAPAWVRRVHG